MAAIKLGLNYVRLENGSRLSETVYDALHKILQWTTYYSLSSRGKAKYVYVRDK